MSAGCRAFEEALLARLDAGEPPVASGHAASCASCAALVAVLASNAETFGWIGTPAPPVRLLDALRSLPRDLSARREAALVLDLLRPGSLRAPEPSPALLSRLAYLPTRRRASDAAEAAEPPLFSLAFLRRIVGDWRFGVAAAYAVTLLLVAVLRIDPMTVAQTAANDVSAAGERALASARSAALSRLEAVGLTKRLDYKVYRAMAASRARAVAYSQLVFEKVFSGAFQGEEPRPGARRAAEPPEPGLRS